MFIEVVPTEGDRIWDLSSKTADELAFLKAELLPFLDQAFRFPDGKYYRYVNAAEVN